MVYMVLTAKVTKGRKKNKIKITETGFVSLQYLRPKHNETMINKQDLVILHASPSFALPEAQTI